MARIKFSKDALRKDRLKAKGGVTKLKLEEGQTLLYICPPCHEGDPRPYCHFKVAYGLGDDRKGNCTQFAGQQDNEILTSLLTRLGRTYEASREGWRRCEQIVQERGEEARSRFKDRWAFSVVPMAFRRSGSKPWQDHSEQKPHIMECGPTVFNPIIDKLCEMEDITDWDCATFLVVKREGTGMNTTYSVDWDIPSVTKPVKLDAEIVSAIEENCVPGGDGDPWWIPAFGSKTKQQIEEIFGMSSDEEEDSKDGYDEDLEAYLKRRKK